MGLLDFFGFGKKRKLMIEEALTNGAVIVDVRTAREFGAGHIKGSLNLPLDKLPGEANKLKKLNKPILLCCASGMRSASAMSILRNYGIECKNAGSWTNLRN